jgi:hypothetical protein
LDHHGNVRLTDFGLSKENVSSIDSGAHSFCGTPEYLAPEVLNRAGHGRAVDWWSLGALLYEMLTGLPPFYCRDRTVLFDQIKKGTLEFPEYLSDNARDILKGLLNRDPARRLGCGPGDATEIKSHPFFASIDWNALLMCRVPPPWVPTVSGSMDTSQFDAEFTSMPIVSPSSLREPHLSSHVARTAFEGFTYVAPSNMTPAQQAALFASVGAGGGGGEGGASAGGAAGSDAGGIGALLAASGAAGRGGAGGMGVTGAGGDDSAGGIGLSLDAPLPPLPGVGSRAAAGRPPSSAAMAAAAQQQQQQQAAYLHAQQQQQQQQWQQHMAMMAAAAQQQQQLQQHGYADPAAAAAAMAAAAAAAGGGVVGMEGADPAAAHMALLQQYHEYQQAHAQAQAQLQAQAHAAAQAQRGDHRMSLDAAGQ